MSRPDGWMPLWIGDYLADTMHLSGPEHGAYLLLLMHSWRVGALPDDDKQLAAIARTDRSAWKSIGPVVRSFFTKTDAGLVQARLERERENAESNAARRSDAARTAANKRWNGNADAMPEPCDTHASRMPNAMRGECPTPSPKEKEPLTPSPDGDGELEQSSIEGKNKPPDWKGQWRGLRANGTNPRALAAAAEAAKPPPPEPDSPLWPAMRDRGMNATEFRCWFGRCRTDPDARTLIAPSAFVRSQIRSDHGHALDELGWRLEAAQ